MSKGRTFWLVCLVLIGVGTILGLRTQVAVRAVLRSHRLTMPPSAAVAGARLMDDVQARDELLAAAVPAARDPFGDPPVARRTEGGAGNRPEVVDAPSLRALLYDQIRPSVQLGVGASVSGWLTVGELFQGWKVDEITRTGVRLSQGAQAVVLQSS